MKAYFCLLHILDIAGKHVKKEDRKNTLSSSDQTNQTCNNQSTDLLPMMRFYYLNQCLAVDLNR